METNPKLGISEYDYHYRSCRCVYCNEVVILTPETLDILYREELERLRRENANNDFFFLTSTEERAIKERIQTYYGGIQLDYGQCIHNRCLEIVMRPENVEILNQIRTANRQNMVLPDPCNYSIYSIDYTNVRECLNICAYCRQVISNYNPGFAYCPKTDKTRRCLFLHFTCFEQLTAMRKALKENELIGRRNFIHLLTAGQPTAWANYSVEEMAARNDAWYQFLSQYELTFDERQVLNEWLNFIASQKPLWSEDTLVRKWLEQLQYDDLGLLVDEQLTALSIDDLTTLEKQIQEQLDVVPVPPSRCIPVPSNPNLVGEGPVADSVLCFGAPSLTMRQPPRLYLNLVQTLRQVRSPPLRYSVFSTVGEIPV